MTHPPAGSESLALARVQISTLQFYCPASPSQLTWVSRGRVTDLLLQCKHTLSGQWSHLTSFWSLLLHKRSIWGVSEGRFPLLLPLPVLRPTVVMFGFFNVFQYCKEAFVQLGNFPPMLSGLHHCKHLTHSSCPFAKLSDLLEMQTGTEKVSTAQLEKDYHETTLLYSCHGKMW